MSQALARVKTEVRKVLGAAIFFSTGFCLILLANRLTLRGYDVELASFARAIVGGFIVAKILLLVDMLPFVDAFPNKPLVHNILWKSSIYVAASLVFRYMEPLIRSLFQGLNLLSAHHGALQEFRLPRTWAVEIWLAALLVIFVTGQELIRVIGKDKVRLMFFGR